LKHVAGAAAAISATTPAAAEPATPAAAPTLEAPKPQATRLEALETLTAAEADTLEAIVARLIPSDAASRTPRKAARRSMGSRWRLAT
jgi:hypothetical protein